MPLYRLKTSLSSLNISCSKIPGLSSRLPLVSANARFFQNSRVLGLPLGAIDRRISWLLRNGFHSVVMTCSRPDAADAIVAAVCVLF